MPIKKVFIIALTIFIILSGALLYVRVFLGGPEDSWICDSSAGWVKHGNPSAPKPLSLCNSNEQTEVDERLVDIIQVTYPKPGNAISSPLKITGRARGNWFFEASFPVVLVDWDGKIIAQGIATAKSDWMTTDFVEFEAELKYEKPTYKNTRLDGTRQNDPVGLAIGQAGTLILKKDNPSGLPQNDASIEIPILFK